MIPVPDWFYTNLGYIAVIVLIWEGLRAAFKFFNGNDQ